MFSHFKQRRLQIQFAVMAILLILIACLPIKIGDSVNKDIPIIGHATRSPAGTRIIPMINPRNMSG